MVDNYEAWLVDVVTNENSLADTIIWAASRDEAIAKAEEWAQANCQEVMPLLIVKKARRTRQHPQQTVRSIQSVTARRNEMPDRKIQRQILETLRTAYPKRVDTRSMTFSDTVGE